ncbi:MAG: hypothetical protein GY797_33365, partial [Deltaproteobacteria bacterium]|nr:hypothetical protein [Deltaproteobacteria bacterium]
MIDSIVAHHTKGPDRIVRDWDGITTYHTSYRYHGEIITIEKAKKLILDGEKVESPWKDNGYNWGIEKVSYFLS